MRATTLGKSPNQLGQNAEDDAHYQVQLKRQLDRPYLAVGFYLYTGLVIPYMLWRWQIINWHIWYGPAAYLAEVYGVVMTLTFLWMTRRIYHPVHRPSKLKHNVDALIPTYTEPLSVLEPTVIGAKRVRGINQIFVLDDGNRPEVRAMALRLGVRYYPRLTNEHAKAGNMNNGLKYSQAEFVLSLDADHIPMPQFLERTMGYFEDPGLAFVQTPQTYYNYDSFLFRRTRRRLWSEQCMFYDMIQLAKNRWNSAFFVGTSAVLRRSALDQVGGFATGTATEDIHTSLRLHARGWKSLFLAEPLAYGLEAASFKEFYKQRRRWAAGSLGLLFRSPDSPLRARGLTWQQRLNYLNATLAHLQGVQKLFFFIIPALCALTLVGPISISLGLFSLVFVAFLALAIGTTAAYSRGTYHPIYTEAYGLANMLAHIGGMKGILIVQKKFAVSVKTVRRQDPTRLKWVFWSLLLLGLVALVRDLQLVSQGQKMGLAISSLVFTDLNLVFLISFFIYLLIYERRDYQPHHTTLAPTEKYLHIRNLFSPHETVIAHDYKADQKTPTD